MTPLLSKANLMGLSAAAAGFSSEDLTLPDGWVWTQLGAVAEFINGDRGQNYPSQTDRVSAGVPFINTGHIEPTGRLSLERMSYITRDRFDKLRDGKVRRGDILYCLRGSTIGKTARNEFEEGAIASSLVIVRARSHALQDYLYYYLVAPLGQQLVTQRDNGSAQPNLSVREIAQYPIPVPPIREQTSICQTLNALDDKIELNRRMNETLEAMARAIFKDWFVDFGPTRAKMEGRAPYLALDIWPLFPDRLDDEGKPEGWETVALSALADLNPESWSTATYPEEIEYVDLANTKWGQIEQTTRYRGGKAPSRAQRILREGDTIVGTVRPGNGSYAYINSNGLTGSTGFAVLRPRSECLREAVFLAATSKDNIGRLSHLADGGAYPAVRPDVVASTEVVATEELLEAVSFPTAPLISRIESNKVENGVLAALRDLLLPKLMSGEIRVKDAERTFGEAS